MNRLDASTRRQIVACLVEGNSIRATCRMTGAAKGTVLKLLVDLGSVCLANHDKAVRNVHSRRVQCDEIWAFCHAKDKNLPDSMKDQPGVGSVWTWTAIDADSKLIIGYHVGTRDADCGNEFMLDVAARLAGRVQMTTDGLKIYLEAVEGAFGADIDYAMLIKQYGATSNESPEARYSPGSCIGAEIRPITGSPNLKHVNTSYVERQNLTMRMSMRRFTRLTNGFSKKVSNLEHAIAIHFLHYNFARIHQTLRVTPAMEAGIADHVWSIDEIVALLDEGEETARDVSARRRDRKVGDA